MRVALLAPLFACSACLSSAASTSDAAAPEGGTSSSATPSGDGGKGSSTAEGGGASSPRADGSPDARGSVDAGVDHARVPDAKVTIDAALPYDASASRCTMTPTEITCTQELYTITTPAGTDPEAGTSYPSYARVVHYQVPLGTAPESGWPAVFMFQGSFLSAGLTFSATSSDAYGMYYQTEVVKFLLDNGFAVLAPEALDSGDTYWQTNIAPYAADWAGSPDDLLVKAMLADVASGTFGPLDASILFATGISSGGYMTSRMAVSYGGRFKALAIESGAYATCLSGESAITGGACTVPTLASTHPPTLFLHGDLDTVIVPEWTVQAYETALEAAHVTYKEVDDPDAGHQWIPEAPASVLSWFQTYR